MTNNKKTSKTPPEIAKVRREAAAAKVAALKASLDGLKAHEEAVQEGIDLTDPKAVLEASAALLGVAKGKEIVAEALERAQVLLHRAPVWESDQPRLAQTLAEVLGDQIHGTSAEAVFSVPNVEVERPRVFVEQGEPDTMNDRGTVSGSAKVVVLFPSWMGDMSTAETSKLVVRTLRDGGRVRIASTDEQLLVGASAV